MAMSCHLSHKLAWEDLAEIYVQHRRTTERPRQCPSKSVAVLEQFAWRFTEQLREFRATDKSTAEEVAAIDAKRWGDYEFLMNGTFLGYYNSLLWGYLELNFLLLDPERVAPLMMPSGQLSWVLTVLCGSSGGSHPENLAVHLRQVVQDQRLLPFSPAVRKIVRDHAALMFRCMYSMTGENKLLDTKLVTTLTFGYFGWRP